MSKTYDQSDDELKSFESATRNLVAGAAGSGADQIGIDVGVENRGAVLVVEDDGAGMTPAELERFFMGTQEFFGADEVHVSTTHDGVTLKARSENPPEYRSTSLKAAHWEEGSRVELRGIDVPDDLLDRVNESRLRGMVADEESSFDVDINYHVDDTRND